MRDSITTTARDVDTYFMALDCEAATFNFVCLFSLHFLLLRRSMLYGALL